MNSTQTSIINTLLYSSLFNSPLTQLEIFTKLQFSKKISKKKFIQNLNKLQKNKIIVKKDQFYFLKKKPVSISKKLQKIKISKQKIQILQKKIKKIQNTPFLENIYLTGSLSVLASSKTDDFDLLIIAQKNRLWLLRFLLILKSDLFNLRRHPNEKFVRNKICFNVFLEEDKVVMPKNKQNIFLAHEIIQAYPLLSKNDKNILINKNQWLRKFIPNSFINNQNQFHEAQKKDFNYFPETIITNSTKSKENLIINLLNNLLYKLQYLYMKPKITNEIINKKQIFFHPKDISSRILVKFEVEKNQFA